MKPNGDVKDRFIAMTIPKPVMILRLQLATQASHFENLLYYEPPSGISSVTQMTAVATAAFSTFGPLYQAATTSTTTFGQVVATYNDGTNEYIGYSNSAALAGEGGDSSMPDQTAVVIRKETNLAGRSNRGRIFISGLDNSSISGTNNNEIDPTYASNFQAIASAISTDQTWDALLFHARHWNRKTNSLVPIAAGSVSSRYATARRRRRTQPDYGV